MSLDKKVVKTKNRTGFFVGPTVKFTLPIVGVGIDASALYDQRETEIENSKEKIKEQAVNIPVNLRYGIGLGSMASGYIAFGPQFALNVGNKDEKLLENTTWKLDNSTFSINVGAGVMLMDHFQVGANYNIVCGKTGELEIVEGVKTVLKGRANAWQIHASYYF